MALLLKASSSAFAPLKQRSASRRRAVECCASQTNRSATFVGAAAAALLISSPFIFAVPAFAELGYDEVDYGASQEYEQKLLAMIKARNAQVKPAPALKAEALAQPVSISALEAPQEALTAPPTPPPPPPAPVSISEIDAPVQSIAVPVTESKAITLPAVVAAPAAAVTEVPSAAVSDVGASSSSVPTPAAVQDDSNGFIGYGAVAGGVGAVLVAFLTAKDEDIPVPPTSTTPPPTDDTPPPSNDTPTTPTTTAARGFKK